MAAPDTKTQLNKTQELLFISTTYDRNMLDENW